MKSKKTAGDVPLVGGSGPPGSNGTFPPLRGHSTARCPVTTHAKMLGQCQAASRAFSELPNLKTKKSIPRDHVQCPPRVLAPALEQEGADAEPPACSRDMLV